MCSEEGKRSAKDCDFEKKYEIVELYWGADQKFDREIVDRENIG